MKSDLNDMHILCQSNGETSFLEDRIRNSMYLFTTFREPESHILSMWKFCRRRNTLHGGSVMADMIRKVPFGSWVHYWADFADRFAATFRFKGTFEEFNYENYDYGALASRSRQLHEPFGCFYIPDNLQATRLGVFDDAGMRATVRDIFHVGVQDMYRETLCVLAFKIHQHTVQQCTCQNGVDVFHHINMTSLKEEREKAGVSNMTSADVLETAEQKDIDRLTYMDRILYEEARQKLEWEIQHIQTQYDPTFLCPRN